jgi:hypothetical protein
MPYKHILVVTLTTPLTSAILAGQPGPPTQKERKSLVNNVSSACPRGIHMTSSKLKLMSYVYEENTIQNLDYIITLIVYYIEE